MRTVSFRFRLVHAAALAALSLGTAACNSGNTTVSAEAKPEPLAITTATVEESAIDRFLRVTGSLAADEQAEVSAEATGRIVDTPVERGTRVAQGHGVCVPARIAYSNCASLGRA